MEVSPSEVAKKFRQEAKDYIKEQIAPGSKKLKFVGLLSNDNEDSKVYSDFTKLGCDDAGVEYEARVISRFDLESELRELNQDDAVTGVIVYYPIFGGTRDAFLRGILSPEKDVEGLHPDWLEKLYANVRKVGPNLEHKAILPCTPLAIIKLLEAAGEMLEEGLPFKGKTVTIFNRSEVVGRPLAFMMANDGAKVYSFDIDGPTLFDAGGVERATEITRAEALKESDIVITGVPSDKFELIKGAELKKSCTYVNFSSVKNYAEDLKEHVKIFIPRVGPVTVAMCLRNLVRLNRQYRA